MRSRRTVALFVGAVLSASFLPLAPRASAQAETGEPVLRLMSAQTEATAYRYGRRPARLESPFQIGVTQGPLDLRVRRDSFAEPMSLTQIVHSPAGRVERQLPPELLDRWRGLDNFIRVQVTRASDGRVMWTELVTWCPNGDMRQRLDDRGPDLPTFPSSCFASPRLLGMTWGIDESWAVSRSRGLKLPVPDGRYSVEISVARQYQELFAIAPEDASVRVAVTVETQQMCECYHPHSLQAAEQGEAAQGVPDMPDPPDSVLPDLRTLPSFGISVSNRRSGRSFLDFGATVWVAGDAPIVVEGFRRSEEAVMDAYQYFYEDGQPVGRAPAGSFIYDLRDGHRHWHILQFVQYRLVDADRENPVRSAKESFCLVPTDPVDLSTESSARTGESRSLYTSCGGPEAIWIRETLPVGWGDTYFQGGRYGFDITDVPNGTYFVEVAANPDGLLHEQDMTNNVSVREVMLQGEPGARRVVVPDPYGIDGRSCLRC